MTDENNDNEGDQGSEFTAPNEGDYTPMAESGFEGVISGHSDQSYNDQIEDMHAVLANEDHYMATLMLIGPPPGDPDSKQGVAPVGMLAIDPNRVPGDADMPSFNAITPSVLIRALAKSQDKTTREVLKDVINLLKLNGDL